MPNALIVDTPDESIHHLCEVWQSHGYTCHVESNLVRAKQFVLHHRPHVVLANVCPDMTDGHFLVHDIKTASPDTLLVGLWRGPGLNSMEDIHNLNESLGTLATLTAPFPSDQVLFALEQVGARLEHLDIDAEGQEATALMRSVNNFPGACLLCDSNLTIQAVSSLWTSMHRQSRPGILEQSLYDAYPDTPVHIKEIHKRCLRGSAIKTTDGIYVLPNGQLVRYEAITRPWYTRNGQVGGIFIHAHVPHNTPPARQPDCLHNAPLQEGDLLKLLEQRVTQHLNRTRKTLSTLFDAPTAERAKAITHMETELDIIQHLFKDATDYQRIHKKRDLNLEHQRFNLRECLCDCQELLNSNVAGLDNPPQVHIDMVGTTDLHVIGDSDRLLGMLHQLVHHCKGHNQTPEIIITARPTSLHQDKVGFCFCIESATGLTHPIGSSPAEGFGLDFIGQQARLMGGDLEILRDADDSRIRYQLTVMFQRSTTLNPNLLHG